jgi:hypothetical protein
MIMASGVDLPHGDFRLFWNEDIGLHWLNDDENSREKNI